MKALLYIALTALGLLLIVIGFNAGSYSKYSDIDHLGIILVIIFGSLGYMEIHNLIHN